MSMAYILIRDNIMKHCYGKSVLDKLIQKGYKVVCMINGRDMSFNYTDNNNS